MSDEQRVWTTWYCRGCKQSPEVECKPDDEMVRCPYCSTEKKRYSFSEVPS